MYAARLSCENTWKGLPACLSLEEGGGSAHITLTIVAGGRTIELRLQSGALPRLAAEMQIFRHLIDSLTLPGDLSNETTIPTGWEHGHSLVIFAEERVQAVDESQPYQEVTGTIVDDALFQLTVRTDDGQTYTLAGSKYHFRGLPVERTPADNDARIVEGDRVTMVGIELVEGEFRPDYLAVEQEGSWQPVFYRSFFDLTRETLDPALLARYPQEETIRLWLRGAWPDVVPYLVDSQDTSVSIESLAGESSPEVLAYGVLQPLVDPPRLILEELYTLNGACVKVSERVTLSRTNCNYWEQRYPPTTTTAITATTLATAPEAEMIVLEQPVEGFITVTLVPDGQLLTESGTAATWEDVVPGTQVQATGEVGQAGTLLAQEITLRTAPTAGEN